MVGKPKSCTACRQAKGACDAPRTAPNPCSKCVKKKLECRFDRNFKRVNTRQITRDITTRLHNARESQDVVPQILASRVFLTCADVADIPEFHLGRLVIPADAVLELFKEFEQKYYAHAPFVQPVASLGHLLSRSPLLFWTICLVAAQQHQRHCALYEKLYLPLRELLSPIAITALQRTEEIHALLLLCLWPVPRRRRSLDPTWSYIGMTVNACMNLGFNKPPLRGYDELERLKQMESINVQSVTWLACFNVGAQVSAFLGLMSPISSRHDLSNVHKAVARLDGLGMLSPSCRASVAINEIMCNYNTALEDVEDNTPRGAEHRLALMQTYDANLSMTRTILTAKTPETAIWTPEVDIIFQFAHLNLYALALAGLIPAVGETDVVEDSGLHMKANKQIIVFRGVEAALALISQFRSIQQNMPLSPPTLSCSSSSASRHTTPQHQQQQQQQHTPLLYYPRHFFEKLFFAATFLFRVLMLSNGGSSTNDSTTGLTTPSHRAMALQGMRDAHEFYQLIPQSREFARAGRWVEALIEKATQHERARTPPAAPLCAAATAAEPSPLTPSPGTTSTTKRAAAGNTTTTTSSSSSSSDASRFAGLLVTNRLGASLVWDTVLKMRLEVVPAMYKLCGSDGPPVGVGGGAARYGGSDNGAVASTITSNGMGVYNLETSIRSGTGGNYGEIKDRRGDSAQVDSLPSAPDMNIESGEAIALSPVLGQQDMRQEIDPVIAMGVGNGTETIDHRLGGCEDFWDTYMQDFSFNLDQQIF